MGKGPVQHILGRDPVVRDAVKIQQLPVQGKAAGFPGGLLQAAAAPRVDPRRPHGAPPVFRHAPAKQAEGRILLEGQRTVVFQQHGRFAGGFQGGFVVSAVFFRVGIPPREHLDREFLGIHLPAVRRLKAGNADLRRGIVFVQIAPDVDKQDRAVVENKFGDLPIRVRPPIEQDGAARRVDRFLKAEDHTPAGQMAEHIHGPVDLVDIVHESLIRHHLQLVGIHCVSLPKIERAAASYSRRPFSSVFNISFVFSLRAMPSGTHPRRNSTAGRGEEPSGCFRRFPVSPPLWLWW